MNMFKVGVYAADYLSLLEFMTSVEKELPQVQLSIYGEGELLESLPAEAMDYFADSFEELLSSNILVLLNPLENADALSAYSGTVIDAGSDPLIELLTSIVQINEELHITLGLPLAIYGREGVDCLMQETRSIYTFDEEFESIFPMPVAFNIQFYKNLPVASTAGHAEKKWEKGLEELRKYATVNIRLNPVSTVFVADLYGCEEIELPDGFESYTPEGNFSLNDINSDHRIALLPSPDGKMLTLIGDYLHMKTATLIEALKTNIT